MHHVVLDWRQVVVRGRQLAEFAIEPCEGIAAFEPTKIGLVRLIAQKARKPFRQKTYDMGEAYVDHTNVAEAIEILEGPDWR